MHKQDNTNRDKGLESIMESMYSPADTDAVKEAPSNSLDDWNDKMNKDDDPDDQYNTSNQVHPDLDDAAGGSLIEWINKQTDTDTGPSFVSDLIQFIKDTEGINDDDTGRIPHDYVPPHDQDRLNRAKKRGY